MTKVRKNILASVFICIGCLVSLAVKLDFVGAFLFSIALFGICVFEGDLFTGRIGSLGESKSIFPLSRIWSLGLTLVLNILFVSLLAIISRYCFPELLSKVVVVSTLKLNTVWYSVLFRSFLCGVIMYFAVRLFQDHRNFLGIFIGIPVFILAGFEHSIANTFYFVMSGELFSYKGILTLILCILGNSAGSIFLSKILKK